MDLSKQQIQHIAKLARIELTDEELKKYHSQLSDILTYIDQLKEVNVDDVEPTTQTAGLENVLREDIAINWNKEEIENVLISAPEKEERFIKVKRIK
ncbi:MAG: Asp-tRNA(Asn)/Glu-tRNA(Gln) amidotransferase subunit GatC [Patescibacteria group bacterium]